MQGFHEVIAKKRDGGMLSPEEIQFWLEGYLWGRIPDYQTAALLMAIYFRGLTRQEMVALAQGIANSGTKLSLTDIPGIKADIHTTGPWGDKLAWLAGPIIAAGGLICAHVSHPNGLQHGVAAKLCALPGFQPIAEPGPIRTQLRKEGLVITGPGGNFAPGDKVLDALLEDTATAGCPALLASSIIGKKLASGAQVLVVNLGYGPGGCVATPEEAKALAALLVDLGTCCGVKMSVVLSGLQGPLGMVLGDALEVQEAVTVLQGAGPDDLRRLSLALAGEVFFLAGRFPDRIAAYQEASNLLQQGAAGNRFAAMAAAQGADLGALAEKNFACAPYSMAIQAPSDGYLASLNVTTSSLIARQHKTGQAAVEATSGVALCKKIGDFVCKGETFALAYGEDLAQTTEVGAELLRNCHWSQLQPTLLPLIYGVVDADGFWAISSAKK